MRDNDVYQVWRCSGRADTLYKSEVLPSWHETVHKEFPECDRQREDRIEWWRKFLEKQRHKSKEPVDAGEIIFNPATEIVVG